MHLYCSLSVMCTCIQCTLYVHRYRNELCLCLEYTYIYIHVHVQCICMCIVHVHVHVCDCLGCLYFFVCMALLASFFLPSASLIKIVHVHCTLKHTTRSSSFFLGKVTDYLGCAVLHMLCLNCCLFDLACFFLSSFSSLIKTCTLYMIKSTSYNSLGSEQL